MTLTLVGVAGLFASCHLRGRAQDVAFTLAGGLMLAGVALWGVGVY